jgi:DNA excision repair protein ERCC-2
MLEFAADCAVKGGVALIDAPTGSGKSSIIAALLANRGERKVVVAVRTISQLTTFVRELELVRTKKPSLKYSYLIGKGGMCPLGASGDVYRRCEGLKAFSTLLIKERADAGSLIPSRDPQIRRQIAKNDREHPLLCPYFIQGRVCVHGEDGLIRIIPSPALKVKAIEIATHEVKPDALFHLCDPVCPYEAMTAAASGSDVVLVNYHHLFSPVIREQIWLNMRTESTDVIILIDEAHNCGEVVESIQSVALGEENLDQALRELTAMKKEQRGADAVRLLLPRITDFMNGLKRSCETEDWFDPAIFMRMLLKGSLAASMDEVVKDAMVLAEYVRERNTKAGEYGESAIERLTTFLHRITQSATDPAYLTVYRNEGGAITLEARSIDPGATMRTIAEEHHAIILVSGSLTPLASYQRLYFDDLPVTLREVPNAFPRENRRVICLRDVTTAFSMREDKGNKERITAAIETFSRLPGNLAVYFPSYQFLEVYTPLLVGRVKGRKVVVEPKDPKEASSALKGFLALPSLGREGLLLAVCGGKWSEGLDYRGDYLAGAMVVGLPLAPFTRVRRMVIDYFRTRFGDEGEFLSYTLPAIHRAQQALGRVLRTPDDRGFLVLAERRFLEAKTRRGLPSWMAEEMVSCDIPALAAEVAAWRS